MKSSVLNYETEASKMIGAHREFAPVLRRAYEAEKNNKPQCSEAFARLRDWDSRLQFLGAGSAAMDDEEVKSIAESRAMHCKEIASDELIGYERLPVLFGFVEAHGFTWPAKLNKSDTAEDISRKNYGAMARVSEPKWWRRQMRVNCGRQVETIAREVGAICKRKAPYVSDWAFHRWCESQASSRSLLKKMEMVEQNTGEVLNLIDAVDASISNPENRFGELALRARGFTELAKETGLVGLFFTLTTPSKYHARFAESGDLNPKFEGFTPVEGQRYLCDVWARIRAEWKRNDIKCFGFRVCEPHHDGTPHWHMGLFFCESDVAEARRIFGEYAMKEDGSEKGAKKHRWDCVAMDESKGDLASYMMKYISKNVRGKGVDLDFEAQMYAKDSALRVAAWASIWGIRQFQQIGSVSVTVWRELRRRREKLGELEAHEAEELRQAADEADWKRFVELMGGALVARDEQTLRPLYVERPEENDFGDVSKKIVGLVMRGVRRLIQTRFKVWALQLRPEGCEPVQSFQKEAQPPLGLQA